MSHLDQDNGDSVRAWRVEPQEINRERQYLIQITQGSRRGQWDVFTGTAAEYAVREKAIVYLLPEPQELT